MKPKYLRGNVFMSILTFFLNYWYTHSNSTKKENGDLYGRNNN